MTASDLTTDVAAAKLRELFAEEGLDRRSAGLRVAVRAGGCSGFQYHLALDEPRDGDHVFDAEAVRLIVDADSLPFVSGSQLTWVESAAGSGYQIDNPNVVAGCGCGSSFHLEDEEASEVA